MTAIRPVKVVRCLRCHNLQLTTASRFFTCFRCRTRNRVGPETVLKMFKDINSAHAALVRLKAGPGRPP
ncbi:hypothetical protein HRbin01_00772 [archaeon HR01]|nr:hypothetical protein HRbin01_00772 [archaeon HR01]